MQWHICESVLAEKEQLDNGLHLKFGARQHKIFD
jgi:hypothetical protein